MARNFIHPGVDPLDLTEQEQMAQSARHWLDWIIKAILPVVALVLFGMYVQSEKPAIGLATQAKELAEVKAELTAVIAAYVTRLELLETLKSVNQQLEIMVLRSKQRDR
jgi:uncharacterized protein YpmB